MKKCDLAREMSLLTGFTIKKSAESLEGILNTIKEVLKTEEEVKIVGFGSWVKRTMKAREGVNPKTREKIQIPAKSRIAFKFSKNLKEAAATEVE